MRTKAEVLIARVNDAREALEKAEHYIECLRNTPCGLKCSGCGIELATEFDFAAHFVISDERFLNLGECPNKQIEKMLK